MSQPLDSRPRGALSWAMYDWANSAFATTVLAGFFPVFYGSWWREGVDKAQSTAELGFANTAAALIVALMAPALGAIADAGGRRMQFLVLFTLLGITATATLGILGQPMWAIALGAFLLASVGFNGSLVFYDAMLTDVAEERDLDRVSSLGFGLGYLGGGLLFAANVAMLLRPELFGLSGKAAAIQASFLTVAVWWLAFSFPIFRNVRERNAPTSRPPLLAAAKRGVLQLVNTAKEITRYRTVFIFILAYVLYIDGVNTVIRMATKFGSDLGFDAGVLMTALLMTQFIAFSAALAFGWLGGKIGPRRAILIGLAVYTGATIGASFMSKPIHFFILAAIVGLVQGGVQALSRSFFARLIPPDKAGEFFGFYNMVGKAAAIFGPTLMAITALATNEPRYTILSLPLLFIAGGTILMMVPERQLTPAPASDPG